MQKPLSRFPEKICSEISPHREIIETIFEAIFETDSILMLAKSSEADFESAFGPMVITTKLRKCLWPSKLASF